MVRSRAAVAWAAGQPLEVTEIDVEGPRAGEALLRVVATGVCHTDAFTLSGADPEGLFPAVLGHEGGAVVEEVGPGVTSVAVGDHVIPLYTPECRACTFCLSGQDQPLPGDPRHPGQGADARRQPPLLQERGADLPLHGHLHLLRVHGGARDRPGEDPQGGSAGEGVPAGLRGHHRHRRRAQHRQGGARQQRWPSSASAASAWR